MNFTCLYKERINWKRFINFQMNKRMRSQLLGNRSQTVSFINYQRKQTKSNNYY